MTDMNLNWRVYRFDFLCPSCGYKDLQLLGDMVGKDSIPCRACHEVIDISDDEWQASLKMIADGISEIYIKTNK
ncbi:MAG: hypothetical protein IH910_07410 [Proteobacteria bacterium]|nr:hypothetical protein [Pseudomonadota bacterium]